MFEFYTLKNGVRVVLVPMAGVESVGVGVYIETGSRYESKKMNGISHFLEHMAFKGTRKLPTRKDTSKLEALGAIQNAWTDVDGTAYWCKIPADKWREGLEVAKELALYPTIPAEDLEIERGVILEEMRRREDRPDELVGEELMKLMFGGNGLGQTTLGGEEVIKTVKREDFVNYHDRQYVSGRVVVALAGKISNQESGIRNYVEEWFGSLPKEKGEDFSRWEDEQKEVRVGIKHKELAAQAHIELAVPGVRSDDPRRFALSLMTAHLGQGLSSRLFEELREKQGVCYAVSAGEARWPDCGVWSVYAGLNIDKLEKAVAGIVTEIWRVKATRLTDKELAAAKEKIRGPLLFSAENPVNQMEWYARQVLDGRREILSYDQAIERVMAVDAESIRSVVQDIFLRRGLNLAIVGPVEERVKERIGEILRGV
ncbi:insulinase family protein [Candidatus Amesbacteria bacterium]|nr:insulinase family protein [Candidatus Amesbacteria bacterium]MBI2587507.1 insulinase family protein [Candidatus Amesbacteria bacterium]